MDPEDTMLSEVSQSQKTNAVCPHARDVSTVVGLRATGSGPAAARGQEGGRWVSADLWLGKTKEFWRQRAAMAARRHEGIQRPLTVQ